MKYEITVRLRPVDKEMGKTIGTGKDVTITKYVEPEFSEKAMASVLREK